MMQLQCKQAQLHSGSCRVTTCAAYAGADLPADGLGRETKLVSSMSWHALHLQLWHDHSVQTRQEVLSNLVAANMAHDPGNIAQRSNLSANCLSELYSSC